MESSGKVLYWFREPFLDGDISCLCQHIEGCRELIPVYCFDAREIEGGFSESPYQRYASLVSNLREDLKRKGSNLLVVYNYYEVIIPSIARVLKVDKVITHPLLHGNNIKDIKLQKFRNEMLEDVSHLLDMHSIPLEVHQNLVTSPVSHLPVFPPINPGVIRMKPSPSF